MTTAVAALIDALRPFAALDIDHREGDPDSAILFGLNRSEVTLGHIRKAKEIVGGYRVDGEWQELARQGKYVDAIRVARAVRCLPLKEAKDLVDASGLYRPARR